jgi:hypothetical protein
MRWRTVALVSAYLTLSHPAVSAEPAKPKVHGAGATSCGVWLDERMKAQGGASDLMLGWALGYISGMEASTASSHTSTDEPAARSFLDGFCKEHPEARFDVASATLSISRYSTRERYEQLLREKRSRRTEASN